MSQFKVKQGDFEGPLDVLLDLIEKRKMHIGDVSLAAVTDDFVAYVQNLEQYHMGNVAHFILVASTLLLIKSRALLPNLSLSEEEKSDIEDLEERLRILKIMREASVEIKNLFGKKIIFAKGEQKNIEPIFSPEKTVTNLGLLSAIKSVLQSIPIKEIIPKAIVKKVISLEDMINRLLTRVQSSMRLSFKQFASDNNKGEKVNIIVGFLAMLELVKQGTIAVNQENQFDDIEMETIEVGTPRII